MHNIFGEKFSFLSFGESHSAAIGGVLDGVPAGIEIDLDLIRRELDRRAGRKNGNGSSVRAKREKDEVEWLSGVIKDDNDNEKWVTLGTPIAFLIRNTDARPEDYEWLRHTYRAGHADRTYIDKYGIRDHRGGGRASARETAGRVVAGSVAQQLLGERGIKIQAELIQVGAETCPDRFDETIRRYQADGDSIGGIIRCTVTGLPAGLGEPIFDKLQSHLAYAMLSINACKGVEYGTGFEGVGLKGSEANHISGGIAGGIADGTDITFRCIFKPTPSIAKEVKGRHDPCVAVRAVPVVEAMAALALANLIF